MDSEQVQPQTTLTSPPAAEPGLLRFTEELTDTPDAKKADGIADMLLIFLSAGGTILGVLFAATAYLFLTASDTHSVPWIFKLLISAGAGGVAGCLCVMAILGAKGLIAWETQARSTPRD